MERTCGTCNGFPGLSLSAPPCPHSEWVDMCPVQTSGFQSCFITQMPFPATVPELCKLPQ